MSRLAASALLPLLWPSLALAQDQGAPLESRAVAAEEELAATPAPVEAAVEPKVEPPVQPEVQPDVIS
ncbi:MAG: hypothetical protein IPN01_09260 [Deltaproteobacteria bacterium]|nr:hypothetical protein [Deltaproteobacteria bacterium]